MKLFLIRHGETPWTRARRYQGRSDIPLNAKGRKQARAIARFLKREKPTRLYTSGLRRAQETAQIIAPSLKLKPQVDPCLNELDFGSWEGAHYPELSKNSSALFRRWREGKLRRPPGGESVDLLARRVRKFFRKITKRHPEETVVVVTHGGPIKMFLFDVLGARRASLWSFRVDPASVSLVQGNEALFQITWTNQTHHLNSR
ncbi:MAG: histidine phosphatase family protein [Candidatus Omnitrophica bacterium]|nr:histidine phosphatase family protein [Candidatus Omnitrophota bacterium]